MKLKNNPRGVGGEHTLIFRVKPHCQLVNDFFFKITSEGLPTIVARVCMEYFKLQIKAKHCFKKVVVCGCCSIYFSSFVAVFLSRMLSFFSLHTELEVVLSVN